MDSIANGYYRGKTVNLKTRQILSNYPIKTTERIKPGKNELSLKDL